MIGRRTFPLTQPGDYGRVSGKKPDMVTDEIWDMHCRWQVKAPDGSLASLNPAIHTVTEHADGTITVEPSIVTSTWHGWLRAGVWTEA